MKERIKLSQLLKVKLRSRTSILFYGLDLEGNLRVQIAGKKMVEQERLMWCLMEQRPGNNERGWDQGKEFYILFKDTHLWARKKNKRRNTAKFSKQSNLGGCPIEASCVMWIRSISSIIADIYHVQSAHHLPGTVPKDSHTSSHSITTLAS